MPLPSVTDDAVREHRVTTPEPADLDAWWSARLADARAKAAATELTRFSPDVYGAMPVYDVAFSGAGGDRIRGWYLRPPGSGDEPLPLLVRFIGYGGGRGLPHEHTLLPSVGFAIFVMDSRGQGGAHGVGSTGDPGVSPSGPEYPGVMTRGIARPDTYYFTRLFVDAARAVDEAALLPGVDPNRIGVGGGSQGGALALAAAALCPDAVRLCHADIPFMCDLHHAIQVGTERPYLEIVQFLANHVELVPAALDTLRYVDCALLARRITADCLLSVGMRDEICPPATGFAAYHEITSAKRIAVSPFGQHATPPAHVETQLRHLRDVLGLSHGR